jgi:DNA-binding IclR family transcriptional regulator
MQSSTAAPTTRGERRDRGLSTARAVLRVTALLAHAPDGVRADEVAEALGKSVSTAYNLLASLCDEGVATRGAHGHYRLSVGFRDMVAAGALAPAELPGLGGLVDDLLTRTHKRAYVGVVQGGHLRILLERGVQGMPKMPGLTDDLDDAAHALSLGKVVLAAAPGHALERYLGHGLKRFTEHTITDPRVLIAELAQVRRSGVAFDREEFEPDFCCMAAPVVDDRGRFLGAVGVSMTRRAYDDGRDALAETLRDVARAAGFQPSADPAAVLAHDDEPGLAFGPGSSVR